jgi:hypothetical protein
MSAQAEPKLRKIEPKIVFNNIGAKHVRPAFERIAIAFLSETKPAPDCRIKFLFSP